MTPPHAVSDCLSTSLTSFKCRPVSQSGSQIQQVPRSPQLSTIPNHPHQGSLVSVATKTSVRSHKEYLDSLPIPSKEGMEKILTVQEAKEQEVMQKRLSDDHRKLSEEERNKAAGIIQRNYRGHRERRMLNGLSLDPTTRWVEAVKEVRYRNLTAPRARANQEGGRISMDSEGTLVSPGMGPGNSRQSSTTARQNWKKIGLIARRAGGDEDSDTETDGDDDIPEEEREARRKRKAEEKIVRQKAAKILDLQYFLELVDLKHRYGSNLRTYHEEWKKSDTNENFFYWLDYGEGRFIDCQGCPREILDSEQVRYLSKEERLDYLVKIDKNGRLCWAKNGARIDTSEKWKDSIHGIVPDTDDTPPFAPIREEAASRAAPSTSSESSSSSQESPHHHDLEADAEAEQEVEASRAAKYATPGLDQAKGMKKVKHVSTSTIFNKLLRGSVKKNTWIFVADTSFRLYVGIKQSGAFQHSSFLHGSRISAAGSIKIKNGRLSRLSPLSGHYRPPVANFRAFVHSLKDNGVDMSHVSISRSYTILVGLEAYIKTRKRGKKLIKKMIHGRDKILAPEEVAKREEMERDKSESAAVEKRFLELKQKADENEQEQANARLMNKLKIGSVIRSTKHGADGQEERNQAGKDVDIQVPGTGPENAIAPEGTRNE